MEDELTEKMHTEFQIDAETEIQHKAFSVWKLLSAESPDAEVVKRAESFGITLQDALKWKDYYFKLRG